MDAYDPQTIERFDRTVHQAYYWIAIIIVRTAATNTADLLVASNHGLWPSGS